MRIIGCNPICTKRHTTSHAHKMPLSHALIRGQRAGCEPYGVQHGLAKSALGQALRFARVALCEALDVPHHVLLQPLAQLAGQPPNARLDRQQLSFLGLDATSRHILLQTLLHPRAWTGTSTFP